MIRQVPSFDIRLRSLAGSLTCSIFCGLDEVIRMSGSLLPETISKQIAEVYEEIEKQYDKVAQQIEFGCTGCPDNCCDSYFLHHTYSEWAYLWQGLQELPAQKRQEIEERARNYVLQSQKALSQNERPQIMCPLLDDGLCGLYKHRLLICRLHGVPSSMTRPDGQQLMFPGCFRCQEITGDNKDVPRMDRTKLFQQFVQIEMEWLGVKRNVLPKVKMTIAEMIIKGPPEFSHCKI